MKLTFWGAARQVTGSMHLLTFDNGFQVLIDCGLDYEKRKEFYQNNERFPFDPSSIDLVVLTHAHIDHSGNLPNLVKQGFKGEILCTPATAELTAFLLEDSHNVQLKELAWINRNARGRRGRKRKGHISRQEIQPLYNRRHIESTLEAIRKVPTGKKVSIGDFMELEFVPAGHILGAASAIITAKENGTSKRIGFTGDLGNYGSKLVVDPQPMSALDYLICESTYGGRLHTDTAEPTDLLLEYFNETCVENNGKLIIPAFSVGRTQAILFAFHQLFTEGRLKPVKIFTDSPLAIKSTRIYSDYSEELNDEAKTFLRKNGNLFEFPNLYVIEDAFASELVNHYHEACVIVSAAGMAEGGRIQEHIRNNIQNPFATVLIAGFCAEGTLGHRLLNGQKEVEVFGKMKEVRARISRTDVFSAHPDNNGLLRYFAEVNHPGLKQVFLVHGEEKSMLSLKAEIPHPNVTIPGKAQEFVL